MNYCDAVSAATHLGTAVWAAFATLVLLQLTRGHGAGRWAVGVYGLTMVLLYTASGVFHGMVFRLSESTGSPRPELVASLWLVQRIDKSAIFLLIAGSYTPPLAYLLAGPMRRWGLAAIWATAVAGVGMIWLWPAHPHILLVAVYVLMGLLGLPLVPLVFGRLGWGGVGWVAALVAAYVGGAVAEVAGWPVLIPGWVGPHEILHISDVLGTLCHFTFVVRYVIRRPPAADTVVLAGRLPTLRTSIPTRGGMSGFEDATPPPPSPARKTRRARSTGI